MKNSIIGAILCAFFFSLNGMEHVSSFFSSLFTHIKYNNEQNLLLITTDDKEVIITKKISEESALLTELIHHWSTKKNNVFKIGLSSYDLTLFLNAINNIQDNNDMPLCTAENLYPLLTVANLLKAQNLYALLIKSCIPEELNTYIAKKIFSLSAIKNMIIKNHNTVIKSSLYFSFPHVPEINMKFSHTGDYYCLSYKTRQATNACCLYETKTNNPFMTFSDYDIVCLSPTHNTIVVGKTTKTNESTLPSLLLYDCDQQKQIVLSTSIVSSLLFSPDGNFIAATSQNKKSNSIELWDLRNPNGIVKSELIGHSDPVDAIAFSPDSKFLISGSTDTHHCVLLWHIDDISNIYYEQLISGQQHHFSSFTFTNDGNLVLAKTINQHLLFFLDQFKKNNEHYRYLPTYPDAFDTQLIPKTGMIIQGRKKSLEIWTAPFSTSFNWPQSQAANDYISLKCNNDGTAIALCDDSNNIQLCNISAQNHFSQKTIKKLHELPIHSLHFNNDGLLLSCCKEKTILLDQDGNQIQTMLFHPNLTAVFFNKDCSLLLSSTCSYKTPPCELSLYLFTLLDKKTYTKLIDIDTAITIPQATLLSTITRTKPNETKPYALKNDSLQSYVFASFKQEEQEMLRNALFIKNG